AWTGMSQAAHVGEGPRPMMIFNPTAWERRDVVRLTVWDAGEEWQSMAHKRYVLRLPDGARVPTQRVSHGRYWGHNYVELEVPVTVPSLGYVVGVVEEVGAVLPRPSEGYFERVVGEDVAAMETGRLEKTGEWTVENEHVRVRFDPISGGIVELTDRETGAQLATPDHPMAVLEYAVERPGRMSAWRKYPPRRRVSPLEAGEVKWTQTGPHRATLSVRGELAESSFELLYTLKAGSPAVEVEIRVDWQQRGGPELGTPSLNLLLPLAIDDARAWYEIPAGSMCRDQHEGEEVPALRWADVVGTPARDAEAGDRLPAVGCALLNDSKHGHSLDGGDLRVSLLRSSYEPDPLPEMGQHVMRLAICPHGRVLTASELTRMGAELNQPLVIVNTDIHEGPLPANGRPAVTVHPDNVLLTALKKAEDDDALILRLQEMGGEQTDATVLLDEQIVGKPAEAVEVDLLERPVGEELAASATDGVTVSLPPKGIASIRVGLHDDSFKTVARGPAHE
ncbi:MAG: glycoside hydrolase family 38 C-terminal domain-containing protein, partial [Planctomycetota bacterium]